MRIVLHIGLSKTGTTAVQTAFFDARNALLERRVLYPDGGRGRENHRYLCPLFVGAADLPRRLEIQYRADRPAARRDAEAMWADIRRQAEETDPALLALSSEYFFNNPTKSDYAAFRRRLEELSQDITVVMYVREPASWFAARVQQGAKQGRSIRSIDGGKLERELPLVEQGFGRRVDVRLFERAALVGEDVVQDFIAHYVAPVVGPVTLSASQANESVSAEATSLMLDADHGPGVAAAREAMGPAAFRKAVRKADAEAPGRNAARLRPEIARDVRRASTDALWLRDRYGVTFPGVDYGLIDGAVPDYDTAQMRAADLFTMDPDRLSAMKAMVASSGARRPSGAAGLRRRVRSLLGGARQSSGAAPGRRD
ncbi:hypothetical protein [Amaricoccus sp.]|uniref:hypothetical protein n=1 Tax=Amaricoccus sp. TaxID=1872485 RepID=UPI001B6939DB|nr:hypothetical protein [Amaricoccus sp.]MBP7003273.1 hypothetical protein [Amaricoccus sp.]